MLHDTDNDNDCQDAERGDNGSEIDEGTAWWSARHTQSRVGILVRVQRGEAGGLRGKEEEDDNGWRGGARVTELLIYGSVVDGGEGGGGVTTPRTDSMPGRAVREVRVRALPLSSDLLWRGDGRGDSRCGVAPLSPASNGSGSGSPAAYFLPPPFSGPQVASTSARKRQRVVNLLDDAALRHKKARRKGGVAVAEAMGGIDGRLSLEKERSLSHGSVPRTVAKIEKEDDRLPFIEDSQYRRPSLENRHSRSPSASSLQTTRPGRPPSRRGPLAECKRSSLSRVDSIVTASDGSPVPEQEKPIEQRNKDALSRTIMAGMRLYGLQQKKKLSKSRAASEVSSQAATPDIVAKGSAEEVDGYKLVYHQTLKGAAFALRRDLATIIVPPAVMREVADKLLAIFCSDPLSEVIGSPLQGFGHDAMVTVVPSRRPVVEPG